jgi:NAD(P)H-dependent flavin oxidoreductase YrpB (nitropropane dioxygenase family)
MWPTNTLTERLSLEWPILQAPMGSASTPSLAAAVTNAGGLGGLGMWGRSAAHRRVPPAEQRKSQLVIVVIPAPYHLPCRPVLLQVRPGNRSMP